MTIKILHKNIQTIVVIRNHSRPDSLHFSVALAPAGARFRMEIDLKMEIKPIRMMINAGLAQTEDSAIPMEEHFRAAVAALQATSNERLAGAGRGVALNAETPLTVAGAFLALMRQLDREYGADSQLPMEDTTEAVDAALRSLAELESWLIRLDLPEHLVNLQTVEIGISY